MSAKPFETSFPCMAAAKEYGLPFAVVANMAWGIVCNARGNPQNGWTMAAAGISQKILGFDRWVELHDRLLVTAVEQGFVPEQELPR